MEHILHREELNNNDNRHDNHLKRKDPIIFFLILIKLSFHFIMLIKHLLKIPPSLPYLYQKLAYLLRQLIYILLSRSQHLLLLVQNIKLNTSIFSCSLLKTYRIQPCLVELDLDEWLVIHIRTCFIYTVGVLIVYNHVDLVDVWVHVVTE